MNPREFETDRTSTDLPETLRQNLVGYRVLTSQNFAIGTVEEVVLDRNRRLYLALKRSDAGANSSLVWLPGQYIQTIEQSQRAISVNLSPADIERLPPYSRSEAQLAATSAPSQTNPEQYHISLLEERLVVNRTRQKRGEIVVRKEVETRMVQIPLRSEKLIVEEVGSQTQLLAEIELSREAIAGTEAESWKTSERKYEVRAEFNSLQAAAEALAELAQHSQGGDGVRVELLVENPAVQQQYQTVFDARSR